jgi:periplasmic iron binding protein
MLRRWAGPLVALLIVGGVAAVLLTNLETRRVSYRPPASVPAAGSGGAPQIPVGGFEHPIGDPQERNHMRIAAVWLPSVAVEGMPDMPGADLIHLEADVHATEGNPNGFAKDEFVPYLKIAYEIIPRAGGPAISGEMVPMVARDGLHYGANVSLPHRGAYSLIYRVRPPSEGGLGRHLDVVMGVAAWWAPFEVSFEWDYAGP